MFLPQKAEKPQELSAITNGTKAQLIFVSSLCDYGLCVCNLVLSFDNKVGIYYINKNKLIGPVPEIQKIYLFETGISEKDPHIVRMSEVKE